VWLDFLQTALAARGFAFPAQWHDPLDLRSKVVERMTETTHQHDRKIARLNVAGGNASWKQGIDQRFVRIDHPLKIGVTGLDALRGIDFFF